MGKGGDAKIGRKVSASASSREVQKFTWAEVKEHITPEDAWVVYQNKVYDVSNWHDHPGGAVVFTHAGDDMTDIFAAFHAQGSQAMMKKFYIGDLIPESVTHKDQRQLQTQWQHQLPPIQGPRRQIREAMFHHHRMIRLLANNL